ncbi:hypothetical protein [Microbulbifer sp. SSSA005]|uniref:hypothetical protein n=1 Tax=Microbulbifer sp. SSSA005 TaxID=3243378 RepID=UPI0040396C09
MKEVVSPFDIVIFEFEFSFVIDAVGIKYHQALYRDALPAKRIGDFYRSISPSAVAKQYRCFFA